MARYSKEKGEIRGFGNIIFIFTGKPFGASARIFFVSNSASLLFRAAAEICILSLFIDIDTCENNERDQITKSKFLSDKSIVNGVKLSKILIFFLKLGNFCNFSKIVSL